VYKLIIVVLILGGVIAVFTAQPEVAFGTETKAIDTRSDIFFTYTSVRYPAKAEIINPSDNNLPIGINADTDRLDFGIVANGGSVKRMINLTTIDEKSSRMHVKAYGDIARMITLEKTDFVFNGKTTVAVTFSSDAPAGNYTGEVDVVIQRSNNDMVRYLIGY